MADKDTTLRFKVEGVERAQRQIDNLSKTYDRLTDEVKKTQRVLSDLQKKQAGEDEKIQVDHIKDAYRRAAEEIKRAKGAFDDFSRASNNTFGAMPRGPSSPWTPGVHRPSGGGGGSSGAGSPPFGPPRSENQEEHETEEALKQKEKSHWVFPRWGTKALTVGAGFALANLGLRGLGALSEGVQRSKEYIGDISDLGRALQHTADYQERWRKELEASAAALGVSRSEMLDLAQAYAKLAGTSEGVNTVAEFARGMGMDLHSTAAQFGQLEKLGGLDSKGVNVGQLKGVQFAALFGEAVAKGGYQGRQEELLRSLVGLVGQQVRSTGEVTPSSVKSILATLSGMGNGPPGLKGEYGAQLLSNFSGGIQNPGGGATGLFMMSQALGIKDYAQLQYTMEEGAFGDNQNLSKVMPYAKKMFPNPRMRQLFYKTWMPGISMHDIENFEKITPAELEGIDKVSKETGVSLMGADPGKLGLIARLKAAGNDPRKIEKVLSAHELGMSQKEIDETVEAGPEAAMEEVLKRVTESEGDKTRRNFMIIKTAVEKTGESALGVLTTISKTMADFYTWTKEKWNEIFPGAENTPPSARPETKSWREAISEFPKNIRKSAYPKIAPDMAALVQAASEKYGVSTAEIYALIKEESGFDSEAFSPDGAIGLTQVMPKTARGYGVDPEKLKKDPALQVDLGVRHYAMLRKKYGADRKKALAAYNAGEKAVDKYGGIPPYDETIKYVKKVEEAIEVYEKNDFTNSEHPFDPPIPIKKRRGPRPKPIPTPDLPTEKTRTMYDENGLTTGQQKEVPYNLNQNVTVNVDGQLKAQAGNTLTGSGNNSSSSSHLTLD